MTVEGVRQIAGPGCAARAFSYASQEVKVLTTFRTIVENYFVGQAIAGSEPSVSTDALDNS